MSTCWPLFLDPGHGDVEATVGCLVDAMGLERHHLPGMHTVSGQPSAGTGRIAGDVERNDWQGTRDLEPAEVTPADVAIFDDFPAVWLLRVERGTDDDEQRRARAVFELVVERLGWSVVLTRDFDLLIATYGPESGVRDFPAMTFASGTGRHVWG